LIPVNHVPKRVNVAAAALSNGVPVLHWLSLPTIRAGPKVFTPGNAARG
jgi:hypothetical protein